MKMKQFLILIILSAALLNGCATVGTAPQENARENIPDGNGYNFGTLLQETSFGPFTVRSHIDTNTLTGALSFYQSNTVQNLKLGQLFVFNDGTAHTWLPEAGRDLTGDDRPDLAVAEYAGGPQEPMILNFYTLTDEGEAVRYCKLDAGYSRAVLFEDRNGDGLPEITLPDWTFIGWKALPAESPAPSVVLQYNPIKARYEAAPELMRKAPPELNMEVLEVKYKLAGLERKDNRFSPYPPEIWGTMLELIYTGNADLAEEVFNRTFPEKNILERHHFLEAFRMQLERSPYWPAISKIYGK